jgi:hypothetical protein
MAVNGQLGDAQYTDAFYSKSLFHNWREEMQKALGKPLGRVSVLGLSSSERGAVITKP